MCLIINRLSFEKELSLVTEIESRGQYFMSLWLLGLGDVCFPRKVAQTLNFLAKNFSQIELELSLAVNFYFHEPDFKSAIAHINFLLF